MSKPTPTPAAKFVAPTPVAPAIKKGSSTCANPVGVAWVTCICMAAQAGATPSRRDLTREVIAQGVAYYTARTQVNRFLQWDRAGRPAAGLPRGVVVTGA